MERSRKAVLFDGGGDATDAVCGTVVETLEVAGWTAERVRLDEVDIAPCRGCFACWVKTPGVCITDDAGRDLARRLIRSDLAVFVTPITFGGYSYHLKKVVDRLIPLILPYFRRIDGEVHHVARYARYPRLLGIGVGEPTSEEAAIFESLVHRNGINMHSPRVEACVVDRDPAGCQERVARSVGVVTGE